ncbi:MAG: adenylyltransferase/cytidyltransferase family protein [Proteobacteria bacterium]|nr:adenylyltransferase/cytidyltransferase family protein [Pseudomonadota bacterium]
MVGGIALGALVFGSGILSDLRGFLYPRRGIGVFFGTFNPFHKTHVKLIRDALENRGLSKVIIHPTVVPRAHRLWL